MTIPLQTQSSASACPGSKAGFRETAQPKRANANRYNRCLDSSKNAFPEKTKLHHGKLQLFRAGYSIKRKAPYGFVGYRKPVRPQSSGGYKPGSIQATLTNANRHDAKNLSRLKCLPEPVSRSIMRTATRNIFQAGFCSTQTGKPAGAFPLDQRFQGLFDQSRLFPLASQFNRLPIQSIININSRAHKNLQCINNWHHYMRLSMTDSNRVNRS